MILANVYSNLRSGYDVSRQVITKAKKEGRYSDVEGLGYGEVDVDSFGKFCTALPQKCKDGTFVDLGSGSGKAVLAAAFSDKFSKCIGVEILEPLHELAVQAQDLAMLVDPEKAGRAHFELGDIFDKEDLWSSANVILVTCTLFTDEMMKRVEDNVTRLLKPGTIIITTTRRLNNSRARLISTSRVKYAKGSLLFIMYIIQ